MKHRVRLLTLLIALLLGLPPWVRATDPARLPAPIACKPPVAVAWTKNEAPPPADDRGYDVLAYDLDLRLDPSNRWIRGELGLRLAALGPLAEVELDLVPEMAILEIRDGGGPLVHRREGPLLTITLGTALATGQTDSLHIAWEGEPPRHGPFRTGLMFRTHDPGSPGDPSDDVPIVASLSQPWSSHSWWPCKDHPSDKAQVSLAVTVPDTLSAVSNGTLLAVTTDEPGWRRYAWREAQPLPPYLVSVAASNYESWSEDCFVPAGPPVRLDYHVFPQDRAAAEIDLAPSCDMMSFLVDRFGPYPYPGEKYAQVEFKWVGAMEHATASSIAQLAFSGDGRFETLFVHEMAHHWFGNSLTPTGWEDIWLSEGFARYSEALWVEHRQGPDALRAFMAALGAERHPDLFVGAGVLADPDPILPNLLVYDKGAWVLHMLRQLIGDNAFFAFLAAYAADPTLVHGNVTFADMVAHAEAAAGRPLGGFFTPWVASDAVPLVALEVRQDAPGDVAVTLSQHQDRLFEVPVPVVLHSGCDETRLVLPLDAARRTWNLALDCPVDSVTIDTAAGGLLRTSASAPPPLDVSGPVPQPAGAAGAAFTLFLTRGAEVVVRVFDVRGKRVHEESLGLLAANGPRDAGGDGHAWRWEPGPGLPSGLHFLEFSGAGGRQVRRVVLVR